MNTRVDTKQAGGTGYDWRTTWRRRVFWMAIAVIVVVNAASAFRRHVRGEGWLSAFGFSADADYLRFIARIGGDFILPVLAVLFMIYTVRRLEPSAEKKALTWIGWSLFVFLFVWWSPIHTALFGTP